MKNILIIDAQKGFLNKKSESVLNGINDYIKANDFQYSMYTRYTTCKQRVYSANYGFSSKKDCEIIVKRLRFSKIYNKTRNNISRALKNYIKQLPVEEIEICGISCDGSIITIAEEIELLGKRAKILKNLVYEMFPKNKIVLPEFYYENIYKSVHSFYVYDGLVNKDNLNKISEISMVGFSTINWLMGSDKTQSNLRNFLKMNYFLYKDNYKNQSYIQWINRSFDTLRSSLDEICLYMSLPIAWYSESVDEIDKLLYTAVELVSNYNCSFMACKLFSYAVWYLINEVPVSKLLYYIERKLQMSLEEVNNKFSDCDLVNKVIKAIKNITTNNMNDIYNNILENLENLTLKDYLNLSLIESIKRKLPLELVEPIRQKLPNKFRHCLIDFGRDKIHPYYY